MRGYRLLLRWAALPITDRRWAAPLSAVALGFGLFMGVAIGPGAAGTLAGGAAQVIAIPGFGEEAGEASDAREANSQAPPHAEVRGQGPDPVFPAAGAAPSFSPLPVSEPEDTDPQESAEVPRPDGEPDPGEGDGEADAETRAGVVVHVNNAAGSYVVAGQEGDLTAIHAPTAPRPGTEVEVPVRPLANGTYGEADRRLRLGMRTRAKISGVVTHVDTTPSAPAYTVSDRGSSLLVHVRPDPAGAPPPMPAVGTVANVVISLEDREPPATAPAEEPIPPAESPGCAPLAGQAPPRRIHPPIALWQQRIEVDGAPSTFGDLAGILVAVCPESGELLISADDVGEGGQELLLGVSAEEIDLARLRVGDSILATAAIASDGALALTGVADDEHAGGADDEAALQGELAVPEGSSH